MTLAGSATGIPPRRIDGIVAGSSPTDRSAWVAAALEAANGAAAFIRERALTRHELVWEEKAANDFVSAVDVGAEERIRESLLASLPGITIVGEELGPSGDTRAGFVAVVDPLDGTSNFLHGYPSYAVSIGIAIDGIPVAGVVHDVARGGVYTAAAGGGAWVDGVRMHVSTTAHRRALSWARAFRSRPRTERTRTSSNCVP